MGSACNRCRYNHIIHTYAAIVGVNIHKYEQYLYTYYIPTEIMGFPISLDRADHRPT